MIYRFGDHAIDTRNYRLTAGGREIAVEPQVFSLLQLLVENRDRVVGKDEIFEHVWDGRIVSDGTLNSRINSARRAIGDDGKAQAVIRTFPRRGFRFVADVGGESIDEMQATPPSSSDGKPSIAVLPFNNMSGDPEQEYFSDGITEDIITSLSRIRQFFVIARNTTFTFKGRAVDVQSIAQELGVRYVLEGSVRKSGNRVRITGQLIDGDTGNHIWAERYDRDLDDIFELQDEITQTVVGAIEPEMAVAERARAKSKPAENLAAWDFYQRGMAVIWDRENHGNLNPETLEISKQLFERAIERDPKFADAYAGLAMCYFYFLIFGYSEDRAADSEQGLLAGRNAATYDSDNALARYGLGSVHIARGEPDLAIHHCGTAVDINPSGFHERIGLAMALIWSGQSEQALPHLEMCLRLSPRNPSLGPVLVRFAEAYFQLGDYEKSVDYATQALLRLETGILGNCVKTSALAHLGRQDEAVEALNELLRRRPGASVSFLKESVTITDPAFLATYLDGLRKAGLPEN